MQELTLSKVFRDAEKHREIAGIILNHLSNNSDIRILALKGLDLSGSAKILDLGCGFGFFSESLGGRLSPEAKITGIDQFPEYEWFFSRSCKKAGIGSGFLSSGVKVIGEMDNHSIDLILCSYAMYFFPDAIPHIARILKPEGLFITITHEVPHMIEFITYVREILSKNGINLTIDLPYETLIGRFSDKTGPALLQPYFREIEVRNYKADLVFGNQDYEDLIKYFNFKESFFIPEAFDPEGELHRKVVAGIEEDIKGKSGLKITKNDVIFICKNPVSTLHR